MTEQSFPRALRRRLKNAGDNWERQGCFRCSEQAAISTYIEAERGQIRVVCSDCLRRTDKMIASQAIIEEQPTYMSVDRKYFEDHPDKTHYVRKPVSEEELQKLVLSMSYTLSANMQDKIRVPVPEDPYIIVVQLEPGVRHRWAGCGHPSKQVVELVVEHARKAHEVHKKGTGRKVDQNEVTLRVLSSALNGRDYLEHAVAESESQSAVKH